MFNFFKRHPANTAIDYPAEFRRLTSLLFQQFSIGHTQYEELLYAMRVIEKEMNDNGGCNWRESNLIEFIETIRDVLLEERTFDSEQRAKIWESINEVIACGRELEDVGESSRGTTEAVDYLIERVVDWCHLHPRGASTTE